MFYVLLASLVAYLYYDVIELTHWHQKLKALLQCYLNRLSCFGLELKLQAFWPRVLRHTQSFDSICLANLTLYWTSLIWWFSGISLCHVYVVIPKWIHVNLLSMKSFVEEIYYHTTFHCNFLVSFLLISWQLIGIILAFHCIIMFWKVLYCLFTSYSGWEREVKLLGKHCK